MPSRRTLSLRKEHLVELGPDRLAGVAGGAPSGVTCPPRDCLGKLTGLTVGCFTQWYQTCGCCTGTNSCAG